MDVIDAHCHIIDPRFPMLANDGYVPQPFTVDAYHDAVADLAQRGFDVGGGVVVSGSFQAFDTQFLVAALQTLGRSWAGVVNLPPDVSDGEILRLDDAGVRAVRCNLYRGGAGQLVDVERLARRVHDVAGWHTEFYLDAAQLPELTPLLSRLPRITIDHFGMSDAPGDALLRLVERGAIVKATGLGRTRVASPEALMQRLLRIAPGSVMFGTDLPSTRAAKPFHPEDATRIAEWAGDHAADVMGGTARELYGLPRPGADGGENLN